MLDIVLKLRIPKLNIFQLFIIFQIIIQSQSYWWHFIKDEK